MLLCLLCLLRLTDAELNVPSRPILFHSVSQVQVLASRIATVNSRLLRAALERGQNSGRAQPSEAPQDDEVEFGVLKRLCVVGGSGLTYGDRLSV